jgi:alpha-D-ribose 1-methylphosphonate 5-triphosphate diphosphatase PhnM
MWIAAAEVIWHRSLAMASGTMTLPEATRMILEKPAALARSAERGAIAAARGAGPGKVAAAFVRPISSRARSNARRLRRRKLSLT